MWAALCVTIVLLTCLLTAPYSYKEESMLHIPSERFSPVRRASDTLAGVNRNQLSHLERIYNQTLVNQSARHNSQNSLKQLQHECHELQVRENVKYLHLYEIETFVPKICCVFVIFFLVAQ